MTQRARCQFVKGSTSDPPSRAEGGEIRHWGNKLSDGRWEWLCGRYAAWTVISPEGVVKTCSSDLSHVLAKADDPVILIRIPLEGK